jgi:hypothetical protein
VRSDEFFKYQSALDAARLSVVLGTVRSKHDAVDVEVANKITTQLNRRPRK